MEEWLIEAGLELVGDDEDAVLGPLERLGRLGFGEPVHSGLGVGLASVLNRSGERDERLKRMALFSEVTVESEFVARRMEPRARHDHRFGLPADLAANLSNEVLGDDPHLLIDGVRVQFNECPEQAFGLALVIARIVLIVLRSRQYALYVI